MLFREVMAVYSMSCIKTTDMLCGKNAELEMLRRVVYVVITVL
jgi:hypothetical protein